MLSRSRPHVRFCLVLAQVGPIAVQRAVKLLAKSSFRLTCQCPFRDSMHDMLYHSKMSKLR